MSQCNYSQPLYKIAETFEFLEFDPQPAASAAGHPFLTIYYNNKIVVLSIGCQIGEI